MRSDKIPDEWVTHAVEIWASHTRRSERAKDSVRNPKNKADKRLYRVHWLEVRMGDILDVIRKEGARKFDKPAVNAVGATLTTSAVPAVRRCPRRRSRRS